ncbi:hypothetical protein ACP3VW_13520 [Vibrio sp. DNB22_17_1]
MSEKQKVFIDVNQQYEAEPLVRKIVSRCAIGYEALLLEGESIFYHLFTSEIDERVQTLMNLNDKQWVALAVAYVVDDHEPNRGRNPREFICKVLISIMKYKKITPRQAWVIGKNTLNRLGMLVEGYTVIDIADRPYPIQGFGQTLTCQQRLELMNAARIANEPNVMTLERVIEILNMQSPCSLKM